MRFALVSGALALAALAACGDNLSGEPPQPASCLPDCPAARTYDAVSYHLHGDWDWTAQTLTASEDVVLDATASGPIVQLDAAVAVTRVHAGDRELAFHLDGTAHTLAVDLTPIGAGSAAAFTVEYTAAVDGSTSQTSGTSLIASSGSPGDPVTSRVVYTDSEPDRALYWLVTKLDPSDRALWSLDLAVDPDEDVISNGARMGDAMVGGKRVVSYALAQPIPPYLMAFAAGQLEHTDRAGGAVPLSVWYRHGLVIDPNLTLDYVADAMATFDSLIMPYPWPSYSVVLLPYSGGMENATITFNDETSGQGLSGFTLNAHELAHHWFGDWVTMHDYVDVWFKEGMATVLESEADRARRDHAQRGRLWGTDFAFNPDDAVVDDTLHGLDKYTSGPYARAGWMISQIRARVGEDAFWAGLRGMLAAHALGSVTGEEFVRSFQPALDEATVQRLLAALPQKTPPALALTTATVGAATEVTLTVTDPAAVLLAPPAVTIVDGAGSASTSPLTIGEPVTVTVPAGGYLGADERDLFPPWDADFGVDQAAYAALSGRFAPPANAVAAVGDAFASRSAAQQEKAGDVGLLPVAAPAGLAAYLASLDSVDAQTQAVIAACAKAASSGDAAWLTAAEPFLEAPAKLVFDLGFRRCGTAYPIATLEPELKAALADGSPAANRRLEYLMSFDYGADTVALITQVENTATSLLVREVAARRLQTNAVAPRAAAASHVRRAQAGERVRGAVVP